MFRNHIKIALRSLWRKKGFALLNILGLAVGLASALVIFLVIRNEESYDTFHTKRDRIYRIGTNLYFNSGEVGHYGDGTVLLGDAFRQDFPQAEKVAATMRVSVTQFIIPGHTVGTEHRFKETEGVFYVEPALFDILDFPWLEGTPGAALKDPYAIALSRSVAEKWFGDWHSAMGKTVLMGDRKTPLLVTGILKDPPTNTDMALRIVLSYATYRSLNTADFSNPATWGSFSSSSQCFVLLHRESDIASFRARLPEFTRLHYSPTDKGGNARTETVLLPLKDQHFDEVYDRYGNPSLSIHELLTLGLIGLFLVLVACINFINLSTAQSTARAKEIGVRKVLGSNRPQVLYQFLLETALLTVIALLLACILTELALPYIGRLMQRSLSLSLFQSPLALVYLLGMGVCVTFLAGFYPGMVLSGFDPVDAIKNKMRAAASGGITMRRTLVVVQFVIAQLLIIGTLVVVKQMAYFRNRPMGFERSSILTLDLPEDSLSMHQYTFLKSRISQVPGVLSTALGSSPPSTEDSWNTSFNYDHRPLPEGFAIMVRFADTDYYRTFHMELSAGRLPYQTDTIRELLINETAVHMLGLSSDKDILGKTVGMEGFGKDLPIVGVLKDFNDKPLNNKEGIKPLIVATNNDLYNILAVRLDPARVGTTVPMLASAYGAVFPERVFDPHFFDTELMDYYKAEATAAKLFRIFAGLAIFISCLGLYGLVSFMAVQKTKEVGVRKVLGASVQSIVLLFSKEFTLLVGIAFLIASPLGYYFMHNWLNGFYYRTDIGWEVFAVSIALSILIAWVTVGYRALRAALADPIKALKHE
jgi:putative ABC transport system permease protein